jgi:hypothetical protein
MFTLCVEHLSALLKNNRLGWKGLPERNALAYLTSLSVMKKGLTALAVLTKVLML